MKISEITIENFRVFKKETIRLGDYVSFVGANGAGKSTILTALRIFFRDNADTSTDLQALTEEDFHNRDTTNDITITVVFIDLEPEAQEDLKNYYRNGKLVVSAVARWNDATKRAEVVQRGEREVIKEFAPFFEADKRGDKVPELQGIYGKIQKNYPELPDEKTKPRMIAALQEYEAAHPEKLEPARSEDQFYGFTKGMSRLQKFIQWIFVPAVKDASSEDTESRKSAFKLLLDRTVRTKVRFDEPRRTIEEEATKKYIAMLVEHQDILKELSESLTQRLARWAHPDASLRVQWEGDPAGQVRIGEPFAKVIGREAMFEGDLRRFGHGFQRSYLLALLQELAACPGTGNPKLILGCEEPELHQHPPQARHLASVLQELSTKGAQVLISTHSPHFVRGATYDDVRLVRFDRKHRQARSALIDMAKLSQLIASALGETPATPNALELKVEQCMQSSVGELFFSPSLVLVEGPEDAGYLETYFALTDMNEGLRKLGCSILHVGGKNEMIRPLAIAKMLGIRTFAVIDADGEDPNNRSANEKCNRAVLRLSDATSSDPFPSNPFIDQHVCLWPVKIGRTVRFEIGEDSWSRLCQQIRERKHISGADMGKNRLFIGFVLALAWEEGKRSKTLQDLCDQIMHFAIRGIAESDADGIAAS